MSDFGAMTTRIADKSHKCIYCVDRIAPGTVHLRYAGVWEGDWQYWRMHKECEDAHEKNRKSDPYSNGEICEGGHLRGFSCAEMEFVRRYERREADANLYYTV